jgi:hypothetical protein
VLGTKWLWLSEISNQVSFQVLTARSTALMMEAVNTSETSFNLYESTQRDITEDGRLNNPVVM